MSSSTKVPKNNLDMIQLFFFISIVGIVICWINGGRGTVVGLSVITCAMIGLLLSEIKQLPQGIDLPQLFFKIGPLVFIIGLMVWYISIFATYSTFILNKQMPALWYSISGVIDTVIFIQLIQLYRFMFNDSKYDGSSTSDLENMFMFIISIMFAWLVMIEYIIATYYRTDG